MARTIPPATNREYSWALQGLYSQAHHHSVDTRDPAVHAFILHTAEVKAQLQAEIRWLRNIIHTPLGVQNER